MRVVPKSWHNETWICSIRGHVLPARTVRTLRPEDRGLGIEVDDRYRLCRCLRCDAWAETDRPEAGQETSTVIPPVVDLPRPKRGAVLQDAILLRLIAVNRAVHSVLFGSLAILLLIVQTKLPRLQKWAADVVTHLDGTIDETTRQASRDWLSRQVGRILSLNRGTIKVLLITAALYAVVEGVEAYGLWRDRRWAEYLTVLATAGFLPFEILELTKRVTVLRVVAIVVNVAILAWLVYNKRLFGLRGGTHALHESTDWTALIATRGASQAHAR